MKSVWSPPDALPFVHQLGNCFYAGTCYRLVSRYHHPFDLIFFVQWFQHQHHLYGRTVWIGNDLVFLRNGIAVYFRNHQLFGRVHSPGAGIIDHRNTRCRKLRRPLQGSTAAGRKDSHIGLHGNSRISTNYLPGFALKCYFLTNGLCRSHGNQFSNGKISFR